MTISRINFSTSILNEFNDIIDVRSPLEYQEDHIPLSLNLPVLTDQERVLVGTTYKQKSKFEAKKMGAILISKNISNHLKKKLTGKEKDWKPLIYCWRGGQRSYAFATILSQIGWKVGILEGGYKSFRKSVTTFLDDKISDFKVVLLTGNTGTAKTSMLKVLKKREIQTIDLEALANHKGSVFGSQGQKQPSQKHFETNIFNEFKDKKRDQYILIEAESNKIGNLSIPRGLWAVMKNAPHIELCATIDNRSLFLVTQYSEITKDHELLEKQIKSLKSLSGSKKVNEWLNLAKQKKFVTLAKELIETHYDPRYSKGQLRNERKLIGSVDLENISPKKLLSAAEKIKGMLSNFSNKS